MRAFKRILKYLVLIALIVGLVDISVVFGYAKHHSELKHSDAAIVLGAAIGSPAAYNRALRALELVDQGITDTIVTSGGKISDHDQSEAQYMARVITSRLTDKNPVIIL